MMLQINAEEDTNRYNILVNRYGSARYEKVTAYESTCLTFLGHAKINFVSQLSLVKRL